MKDNTQDLQKLRHSAAHLLAHAVHELFPNTQLTIGPATQTGFFYDFLPVENFKQEDLKLIQERMREIAKRKLPITHEQMPKKQARQLYKNNPFKLELIDGIDDDTVGIARQGDFYDLCKGGHVESTGDIKHFKLHAVSGAYWRADKTKQALQRISGTAFFSKEDLKKFEQRRLDAIKYDHRKVGTQQDLFSFQDEGPGFPFFHPNGMIVLNELKRFLKEKLDRDGYQEVSTPTMLNADLWKQSGHYAHYKENMYVCMIDEKEFAIKPMNCPGTILVYKNRPHSYRELPMRLAEFGHVHRYELSGVLHGLFRVRAFTQDDAHIFCTPEQIEQEVLGCLKLAQEVYAQFGFTVKAALAIKPDKAMGSDDLWNHAINPLKKALEASNTEYEIDEKGGAFYGPKIDLQIEDSLGRLWQCSTIQVDFVQPENFDLSYVSHEGKKERPVIIHRAIYGSFERFLGILIEHFKGKLPFWLAPVQIKVLTITDEQKEYAQSIIDQIEPHHVRIAMDESSDPISGKIKRAQLEQVPWMLVIGHKEMEQNTVTLRYRSGKQEFGVSIENVIEKIRNEQA